MKAGIKEEPGPGITYSDVSTPTLKTGEVLLKIGACGICGSDLHIYHWHASWRYLEKYLPKVLGHEFSGTIVELANDVRGFSVGDRVAVEPGVTCGECFYCRTGQPNICISREILGIERNGGFAEFASVPARNLYKIPDNLSFEVGAFLEIFALAVHAVERSAFKIGDKVAVLGVGPIGLSVIALTKSMGASRVVATGVNADALLRLPTARKLGADKIVNVESEISALPEEIKHDGKFDVVFEISGSNNTLIDAVNICRIGGEVVLVGVPGNPMSSFDHVTVVMSEILLRPIRARKHSSWLKAIKIAEKMDVSPIIQPIMKLKQIDDAFRIATNKEGIKVIIKP